MKSKITKVLCIVCTALLTVFCSKSDPDVKVTGVSLNKTVLSLTEGESETLKATLKPEDATNVQVAWSSSDSSVAAVDQTGKVTAVKEGEATVTVKTIDGGKTATCKVTVSPKNVAVTGVELSKTTLSLTVGKTENLTATVKPDNATNKSVTWRSDKTDVATVDANGKVTAVKEGEATITVTTVDGAKTAECKVTVSSVTVTGVSLNKTSITLVEGANETLVATVEPTDAANRNVTWRSDKTTVAVVDQTGKVTAIKAGTAYITVTTQDGGKTATCEVTVVPEPVTGISLNKTSITLTEGADETLVATVRPSNAANKKVNWTSDDTTVAVVDATGKVVAMKAGSATVTATTVDGGFTATCTVTVTDKAIAVTGVSLNKPTLELVIGKDETLTATVEPANATNKNVTWKSSKTDVATVDNSGKVTAVAEGNATITVTTEDGSKEANCLVTVSAASVAVESVILDKTSLSLMEGETKTLTATVSPLTATNKNVTWTSDKTAVATVDNSGKVTAVKEGTATIKVVTEDGLKTAECKVTVNKIAVQSVTVSPSNLPLGTSDAAKTLTATVSPSNATYKSIVWSSSDPTVATVDKNGNVTPVKAGTATITATSEDDNTRKGTCTVTVGKDITSEFDAAFAQVLQTKGYVADATRILDAEAANVTNLNVSSQSLTSLKGIEYFTNLTNLNANVNNLTSIDLSKNTKLSTLYLIKCGLTTIDVSKNTELTYLSLEQNSLSSIDVSNNAKLQYLGVYANYKLTSLDVSKNTELTRLYATLNNLTTIDVSKCTKLTYLQIGDNKLTSLDLSKNTELKTLIAYNNKLTSIDVSKNTKLITLSVLENPITSLDVSKNTKLTELYVKNTGLTSMDISANTNLTKFNCTGNAGDTENNFVVKVWSSFPDTPPTNFTTGTWTKDGNTITVVYQK